MPVGTKLGHLVERQLRDSEGQRVREESRQRGLVQEKTTGTQHARDFRERAFRLCHAVARPEVDHEVERPQRERKRPEIPLEHGNRTSLGRSSFARGRDPVRVDVDGDHRRRLACLDERPERRPLAAADVENRSPGREAKKAGERRDLESGVQPVSVVLEPEGARSVGGDPISHGCYIATLI